MIKYRFAERKDCLKILEFIKALAEYEKMSDQVIATEKELEKQLFDDKRAEVIFALDGEKEIGFALFFTNFSTFVGKAGLYLEDLFVFPEYRGKGYGKGLLKALARIAVERNAGRFEWCCLNWNTSSIDFYLSCGAKKMDGWTTFRLDGKELAEFSK
jgi:GNAT superfamily N-acetyltransferase